MMYDVCTLPYSICTTQNTPLPSPPLPSPDEKKGYFNVHLPEKAFPFYTYLRYVRIRVKSVASVSIIRFFAWQEGEGEFAKRTKKEGMKGSRQAGRFYKGRYSNIIQYRYRYIVRMFKFSYLVVHGAT